MIRRTRTRAGPELDRLIDLLAKLPGLGPRSATRAALHLLKHRDNQMAPLASALAVAAEKVRDCSTCGNLSACDPCQICTDPARDDQVLGVVADVGDLWALERSGGFAGRYHVLGGLLSALDGVSPKDLRIGALKQRVAAGGVREVVLALSPTVDGQTTGHYVADVLEETGVAISRLTLGIPVGGELEHLDDMTLKTAMRTRSAFGS